MTTEAPGLLPLAAYVKQKLGRQQYGGIVGDGIHLNGYHLGRDRIFSWDGEGWDDYSVQTGRDRSHLTDEATAIDIGNDWPQHKDWLLWLVAACRQGKYPDVREIIGTLDGKSIAGWDAENHWVTEPDRGDYTHLWHTHISFYRDSAARNQIGVLRDYLNPPAVQKPTPVKEAVPVAALKRAPVLIEEVRPRRPADREHDSEWLSLYPLSGVLAVGVTAWILSRRMELAREDSR